MTWTSMLSWWQWAILGAVPPAIVLLYFLKLKRQPLEVPSTYLWHKSIEDLHVNSIWQRLRQNLLLFLQLLIVALAMIALLRPAWQGAKLVGHRFVFLIDNSASMSARDVDPARLDEAKRKAGELIDGMASGDVAMLLSFSDSARVEQQFTDNRRDLRRSLEAIGPTQRPTSLGEALRVAAGLANPGKAFELSETQVAEGIPATIYIFSDGKFPNVEGFSLGNLKPKFVPIGQPDATNVGITAFNTRRPEGATDKLQAFGRIENHGLKEVEVEAELFLDDQLIDASKVSVKAGESTGVVFDLESLREGMLKLQIKPGGQLAADDVAWAPIQRPRRSKVLLATPGNDALELALATERAVELADVSIGGPEVLEGKDYLRRAAAGEYDLVIYDQCQPKGLPQANTLFIGSLPPGDRWAAKRTPTPQVIDTSGAHPLMQLVDLGNVKIAEGFALKPPPGGSVLIDSDAGPLFAIAPREGFEDAVLGIEIVGTNEEGEKYANTDWPLRLSFPVFALNVLGYLGGARDAVGTVSVQPGRPVELRTGSAVEELTVVTPGGSRSVLKRNKLGTFNFSGADQLGAYRVEEGGKLTQQFAVNLFDPLESDIKPVADVRIGYVEVPAESGWEETRREAWKLLLIAGLAVLLLEWYIYNRRVYL